MQMILKVRTEGLGDVGQVKKLGEEREDSIPARGNNVCKVLKAREPGSCEKLKEV